MKRVCKLTSLKKFARMGKYCLSVIVFSLAAFSCAEDKLKTPDDLLPGEETEIVFSLNVPAVNDATPQLRSIGATEENTIKTINLLAFRKDNTGSYFSYQYEGALAADNTPGSSTQKCRVKVRMASYEQDLVMITNAGTIIDDLLNSKDWTNTPKETFLANLQYALSGTDSKWNTISISNYTALPMWGETSATVTQNTNQLSLSLLRMLAKIDVQLDNTDNSQLNQLKSIFKLKSVRLYNTNTNAQIVPNSSVVTQSGDNVSVSAPSIPSAPGKILGPLVYQDFSDPGITDVAMKGAIYLFETKAPDSNDSLGALAATCVVVGGIYGTDTKETFYRVDFQKDGKFQDILRNHRYLVNIVSVTGSGYNTDDEAFHNRATNMNVNILDWDESDMFDVTFDGQWYLAVSRDAIDIAKGDTTNFDLSVITDYNPFQSTTSGWYVESVTDSATHAEPTWLQVDPRQGAPNELKNVKITTQLNTSGKERAATIMFVAGRLRYPVTIRQTLVERPTITINYYDNGVVGAEVPGEIVFKFKNPQEEPTPPFQGVQITVTPVSIPITMYRTNVQGIEYAPFSIAPDAGVIRMTTDGTHIMVIAPPKVTADDIVAGAYLREEELVIEATNGSYNVTKNIILRHVYSSN